MPVRSIFLLMALLATSAFADPYSFYELPTADLPDLHDGSLDDWREVLPGPTLTQFDFTALENVGEGAPIDPGDLAYDVYLAWHSRTQKLFVAFEIVDDVYVNEYEGDPENMWRHDSVEFMVDGDHSGGEYQFGVLDETGRRPLSSAQQYFAIASSPNGRLLELALPDVFGPESPYLSPPFADAGGRVRRGSPAMSTIELAVTPLNELNALAPQQTRPSRLSADRIIGFEISIPDFDSDPSTYHGFYNLSGHVTAWRNADLFVDGVLVGCDRGDCGADPDAVTEVEATSWARVKTSLGAGQWYRQR